MAGCAIDVRPSSAYSAPRGPHPGGTAGSPLLLLRGFGEVETPGDNEFAIDNEDLIVRNGVVGIDHDRYTLIGQEVGGGILVTALALVEDDLHLDPALMGVK